MEKNIKSKKASREIAEDCCMKSSPRIQRMVLKFFQNLERKDGGEDR
jgi:ribosome recycling factor